LREWKPPSLDQLNVNGSGISLGHPVGATGTRILATLLYDRIDRVDGALVPPDDPRPIVDPRW
jgi:acetyl-CoA acetyltransferase